MRLKLLLICLSTFLTAYIGFGQGVKISTTPGNVDSSAILEVESTNKGFLPPRMTTAERNLISNPANGLTIFNTTTECLNLYVGGIWKAICPECDFTKPVASLSSGVVCEGDSVQLIANSIPGATYSWTGPSGFTSNQQSPVINPVSLTNQGSYQVTATVSGCSRTSDQAVLSVLQLPTTANAGSDITLTEVDTLFQSDFNVVPAAGMTLGGAASYNVSTLELTPNTGGQWGYAFVNNIGGLMGQIGATRNDYYFQADMFHGGGGGADEHSFWFGDSAELVSVLNGNIGPKVDGGSLSFSGLQVFYCSYSICGSVRLIYNNAVLGTYNSFPWRNQTVPTTISIDTSGNYSLTVNSVVILTGSLPSSYLNADKSNWTWGFSGRTGGITDFHRLDNMLITSTPTSRSITLNGNSPSNGNGFWSILSGVGGAVAVPSDPNSTFTGNEGETYTLEWTITSGCGGSSDQVDINF